MNFHHSPGIRDATRFGEVPDRGSDGRVDGSGVGSGNVHVKRTGSNVLDYEL